MTKTPVLERIRKHFPVDEKFFQLDAYVHRLDPKVTTSQFRYRSWKQALKRSDLLPNEFILPRISRRFDLEVPPFMHPAETSNVLTDDELKDKVKELSPWGFYFKLREGIETSKKKQRDRIYFRSRLITETVVKILGEDLPSMTALDLGCNSGFFTLDLASRGARSVHGLDLRKDNITRARFLAQYYGVENASFSEGDVTAFNATEPYDIVLNLGLMYHVTDPLQIVRKCYDMAKTLVVFDTVCHREPVSALIILRDKKIEKVGEGKDEIEFHPTYRGMIDMILEAGFSDVIEVCGTEKSQSDIYAEFTRRCFLCFK